MEQYIAVFQKVFEVKRERVPEMEYKKDEEWDSIGHMELITELEAVFGLMMETEDIVQLTSFQKGIKILEKYGIELSAS